MSKTRTIRFGTFVFALVLTATVTLAQAPGRPGGGFGDIGDIGDIGDRRGPPGLLERMADKLELSEQQRETIRGLVEKHRDDTAVIREDFHGLEGAVEEAIHAEPFDEEAVRAVALQVADVRVELTVARARLGQEIQQVLTPEQREMAAEMRERRKEFRDDARGRGGRGGGRFEGRGPGARRGQRW
ncbi:MAG: Spy/CpxP family protein refolding chaperone [Acidobacteriota bacterium]|nr:Spy/CpxP family protein refolding chaperone [Acidobacteriota bacterium]